VSGFSDRELDLYFRSFQALRAIGPARVKREQAAGRKVKRVTVTRWTAQPADSVPVEVATKAEAVAAAERMGGGKWKHEAPSVYRVTPPGARRPRRVRRRESQRLAAQGWVVRCRESERWVVVEPPAPQTRNKYRDLLRASFEFAIRQGWLEENPMDAVARLSRKSDRRRILRREDFYNQQQVETFLAQAPGLFEEAFWLCGFHAGLRLPGEALGLTWGAVDFGVNVLRPYDSWKGTTRGSTKTPEFAPIPMTPRLCKALEKLKERSFCVSDDDFVFTRDELGRPASPKRLRAAFEETRKTAGLKSIPMYNTRHSFGTGLAREGIDVRTIQALMRHKRLDTTEIYMAYAPQPDLAHRIGRALDPATSS
jgi:integrase